MNYAREKLEKGICPLCNESVLIKQEFHKGVTVVYHTRFSQTKNCYVEWKPAEIQHTEDSEDPDTVQFECGKCQVTFYRDNLYRVD